MELTGRVWQEINLIQTPQGDFEELNAFMGQITSEPHKFSKLNLYYCYNFAWYIADCDKIWQKPLQIQIVI